VIVTELLEKYGIEFHTSGRDTRPGWAQMTCPYCGGDKYLGVSTRWGNANCWRCGPLKLFDVIVESKVVTPQKSELAEDLRKLVRDGDPSNWLPDTLKKRDFKRPRGTLELQKCHKRFLRDRGFHNITNLEVLWGVRGFLHHDRFRYSLYIPIHYHGDEVSFTTRTIYKDSPYRYRSASNEEEGIHHKHLLYGEDYARNTIIICEGPLDVWKIGPGAVCTFGTSYTKAQVLRMVDYPCRVVCYDNESEAQQRASELTALLSPFHGSTFNVRLKAKDPGEAQQKEIDLIRKKFLL